LGARLFKVNVPMYFRVRVRTLFVGCADKALAGLSSGMLMFVVMHCSFVYC
jgi:hypothetical protein